MQPTKNIIECKCCKNVYQWKPEDEAVIPRAEWSKKVIVSLIVCNTKNKLVDLTGLF